MPKNVSQSKDAKKCPMDTNFQTHASTGCKVEMASANAVGISVKGLSQLMLLLLIYSNLAVF